MKSALVASRSLAWIAIVISDAYLGLVLLFTAILSDGEILGRSACTLISSLLSQNIWPCHQARVCSDITSGTKPYLLASIKFFAGKKLLGLAPAG
jgi:hypothetical protein